jgi:hypothetical protein
LGRQSLEAIFVPALDDLTSDVELALEIISLEIHLQRRRVRDRTLSLLHCVRAGPDIKVAGRHLRYVAPGNPRYREGQLLYTNQVLLNSVPDQFGSVLQAEFVKNMSFMSIHCFRAYE